MNKKICIIIVIMLLYPISFTLITSAGTNEDPEIIDEANDNELPYLDIISAWFYENPDEPTFLYTVLKLRSINLKNNACLAIRWSFNEKEYVSGFDIYQFKPDIFRSGDPKRATYWQWKSMPECDGTINSDIYTLTWKIPKNTIGNPQKGDILENTRASAVPGFPISFIYFFTGKFFKDFAPSSFEYGNNYIINY